jgi:N-acetylmuramoyl-L-alanine amidase
MISVSYTINVKLIPGLPKHPYRHGVGAYEGVVFHCTDSDNHSGGDTPTVERNYEANTWDSAFVHFFVGVENGKPVIIQTADTNYIAYGAGWYANQRFVHIELCMYDDPQLFKIAYDAYVWLGAKLLHDRKLGVSKVVNGVGTVWSHADVTRFLGNTDHDDPIAYLAKHGISWDQHIANVKRVYDSFDAQAEVKPPAPQSDKSRNPVPVTSHPTLKLGDKSDDVKLLQQRLGVKPVDGVFGPITLNAVKQFQQSHGLTVDGIVGPQTWAKLLG